jgi:hypothetical protein
MTRNTFIARAARVAVTISLAALIATPGAASSSTHFFSLFSAPTAGSFGNSLGSNGIANPLGGLGHGLNLDFAPPHLSFGTGGGSGSAGSALSSFRMAAGGGGAINSFATNLHASTTFSLAIHSSGTSDPGITSYEDALRNGQPTSWLSAYYQNNEASVGNIVGKDRTNPIGGRRGCPPVPEANTSLTFGMMLLVGFIGWRYSARKTVRQAVRI